LSLFHPSSPGWSAYTNNTSTNLFNQAHTRPLYVIGTHDTDAGFTKDNCIDKWGIPSRYYARDIEGLQLLVLDGNDAGSPTYKGGYVSYVGKEQVEWLKEQIAPRIRDREFMRVST
jgi:Icc protein